LLPLRDDNPTHGTPWVTLAIIALNVLAFLLGLPFASGPGRAGVRGLLFCQAEILR
jgi:hypothetical protein